MIVGVKARLIFGRQGMIAVRAGRGSRCDGPIGCLAQRAERAPPGRLLRLDARRSARLGFWPRLGGRDELSGVFGGMPSFASKTATRSANVVTCAACPAKASTCDTISVINSSLDRACSASRSIQTWNHAARPPSTIPSAPTLSRPASGREQLPLGRYARRFGPYTGAA